MYEAKMYRVPICSICSVAASVWACDIDPESQTPISPHLIPTNDWLRLKGNIFICSSCADVLRSMFMEEQKPKSIEANPIKGSFYNPLESKEEHWITRNGTRVVVKMPLPAVGSIYNGSPIGMGEKPTLIRWDEHYNCQGLSWINTPTIVIGTLHEYDLVERLEDSI